MLAKSRSILVLIIGLATGGFAFREAAAQKPSGADSKGGMLLGTVHDSSGRPVAEVQVFSSALNRTTRSDSAGQFVLADLPVGTFTVRLRRVGYKPSDITVQLKDGDTTRIAVIVHSTALTLETVNVLATAVGMPPDAPSHMFDFYRRRKAGFGIFFTREDIDKHGSVRAALQSIAGVRILSGPGGTIQGVRFVRCSGTLGGASPVAYFVNGQAVGGSSFAMLNDTEITAIEVYKGPASMPAEAVGNACAAVFAWTK